MNCVCAVGESFPSFIPFIYPSKYRKCHLRHCYSFLSEANSARQSLFEKLTQLEITVSTRDAQRLTIQAQAEEMVSLTKEVALLKEDCFALTRRVCIQSVQCLVYVCMWYEWIVRQVESKDRLAAGHSKSMDILQQEINRLRKELVSMAKNQTEKVVQ